MAPNEKRRDAPRRRRIETQIHRRKKAPPVGPLEAEWDQRDRPPERLRMPPDQMNRRPPTR